MGALKDSSIPYDKLLKNTCKTTFLINITIIIVSQTGFSYIEGGEK